MIMNLYLGIIELSGGLNEMLNPGNSIWGIQVLWIQNIIKSLMDRIRKAVLLQLRRTSYRCKFTNLYYWTERKLEKLRTVDVMPFWYYRRLYKACMWLVAIRQFQRFADRAIHTIPYHVRFEVA